jgi:uncharacterized Zn finger protein
MAGEAVHAARLLANELPPGLDDLVQPMGLTLLPTGPAGLEIKCTCRDDQPCKHAAAVGFLAAERLAQEPTLIFTLLGMSAERVLEWLRRARTIRAHGLASAHADPMIPESQVELAPLETCLDEFWHSPIHDEAGAMHQTAGGPSAHVPHALLRRLGPSPLSGRFPMVGLLASVYDAVAAAAGRWRDQIEPGDQAPD